LGVEEPLSPSVVDDTNGNAIEDGIGALSEYPIVTQVSGGIGHARPQVKQIGALLAPILGQEA